MVTSVSLKENSRSDRNDSDWMNAIIGFEDKSDLTSESNESNIRTIEGMIMKVYR